MATPVPLVDCDPPVTVPLVTEVAANVTETPDTALPPRSVTFTDGAGETAVFTVPLSSVALFAAIVVACPGFAVAVNVTGDPDGTVALACTVGEPAILPSVRVTLACPAPSVGLITGPAPPSIAPPPAVIVNVTFTPLTAFPN